MPNALQITGPDADNPLAQAPRQPFAPWSQFDKDADPLPGAAAPTPGMSQLDLWLAEQRAKNAANQYEPLPGITSGAPPKPWGLNRDQPLYNQLPAYGPGGRGVPHYIDELQRIRPMQEGVDPGMTIGDQAMPGTRSTTPVIMQQRPQWKYRET